MLFVFCEDCTWMRRQNNSWGKTVQCQSGGCYSLLITTKDTDEIGAWNIFQYATVISWFNSDMQDGFAWIHIAELTRLHAVSISKVKPLNAAWNKPSLADLMNQEAPDPKQTDPLGQFNRKIRRKYWLNWYVCLTLFVQCVLHMFVRIISWLRL